jgi:hypothetical protein
MFGMMECWSSGEMEIPTFHYSIIPASSFNGSLFFKNEKLVYIILFSIKRHLSKSMPFI